MKKNFIISVNNTEDVNNIAKKLRDLGCKIDTISSFSGIITGSTELLLKELEIEGVKYVEEEREVKEM